jgi:hypothetical protein
VITIFSFYLDVILDSATSLEETAAAATIATPNTAGAEAAGPTIGAGCLVANATTDLTVRRIRWIHFEAK